MQVFQPRARAQKRRADAPRKAQPDARCCSPKMCARSAVAIDVRDADAAGASRGPLRQAPRRSIADRTQFNQGGRHGAGHLRHREPAASAVLPPAPSQREITMAYWNGNFVRWPRCSEGRASMAGVATRNSKRGHLQARRACASSSRDPNLAIRPDRGPDLQRASAIRRWPVFGSADSRGLGMAAAYGPKL